MFPLLLVALLFAPEDAPPPTCSLSGTVVNAVTGEPLTKAQVALMPHVAGSALVVAPSDAKGNFTILNILPGRYRLRGHRSGYLDANYGGQRPESDGTILTLDAGSQLKDLTVKLTPYGVISGTIRDSDGEPLVGARVVAARQSYDDTGQRHLAPIENAETDDRGEYRIRNLPPGKYYVGAEMESLERMAPALYPGGTDAAAAHAVEIAAGARVGAIDMVLARAPGVHVRGRLANGFPQLSVSGFGVTLTRRDRLFDFGLHAKVANAAGEFEFAAVPPGSYWVETHFALNDENVNAFAPVEVGAADVEGVRLALGPGADVKGRIVLEGADGEGKPPSDVLGVMFIGDHMDTPELATDLDGSNFTHRLAQGHYRIFPVGQWDRKYFLKRVRSGDVDVLAEGLTVSQPGMVPLEIVLAPGPGQLEGAVLDSEDHPAAGATVVLVPQARSRAELFKTASTDQSGRFQIPAVAPGDYRAFAWMDVEPNAWFDGEFLKVFEARASSVTVGTGERQSVQVRVADGAVR